jgi:hypothetical protein
MIRKEWNKRIEEVTSGALDRSAMCGLNSLTILKLN